MKNKRFLDKNFFLVTKMWGLNQKQKYLIVI